MSKPYNSYLSGAYLEKNPTWDDEDSEWKAGKVLEIMRDNSLMVKSIADIGCGAGGVLAALAKYLPDAELSGYDIAPAVAKFWEDIDNTNICLKVGDFFTDNIKYYDVVLLLDVLEHVVDPHEFLARLKPYSDYIVIHFPLDLSAMSVLRESPLLYVRHKVGHIHSFTKGLALALLQECGYEVLDWQYTGAAFNAPQSGLKTWLARMPRSIAYAMNKDFGVRLLGGETLMVLAKPK